MVQTTAPLAIASVTAILKDLLGNALIRYSAVTRLGDVSVSVLPPDRVTVGADESSQLNLFLYKVTPHTILRDSATKRPPTPDKKPAAATLTLDLHYILTAYGAQDFHEELLLGCAAHLFGSTPTLTRELIRKALEPSGNGGNAAVSPVRAALAESGLAEQVAGIKIRPQFLDFEEMSKLWSMLQARYRPSLTYEVSAVTMIVESVK
jgi:hypothetical protein